MRGRGLRLLRALHERGGVVWEAGVPGLLTPEDPDVACMLHEDRQTLLAVLRRAAVFRRQLLVQTLDPFLRFRDPRWTAEGCPSCGGKAGEHEFLRCDLCALGVELALAAPAGAEQPAPREHVP